jgi:Flp pilus assembly protein TadG
VEQCDKGVSHRGAAEVSERGQASVEVAAAVPALMLLALVVFQLLAVGYSAVLAGDAAEAGALALAGGGNAGAAARDAVPGWSRARMAVSVSGAVVRVALRPPSPLAAVGRRLEVHADAEIGKVAG